MERRAGTEFINLLRLWSDVCRHSLIRSVMNVIHIMVLKVMIMILDIVVQEITWWL
jgi:hypothetical protein